MSLLTLFGIAVAMGMDVFSVSMAVAAGPRTPRQTFRLSFHFGLFQFFMPLVGWAAGRTVVDRVAAFDHWIALALLVGIGGHMVYEGFQRQEDKSDRDRSRGWSLVALSVATSLDALGVGLTFGVAMTGGIVFPALVIGAVSSAMSLLGIYLSRRLKRRFGHHMEVVGGMILIGIGIKFFFSV